MPEPKAINKNISEEAINKKVVVKVIRMTNVLARGKGLNLSFKIGSSVPETLLGDSLRLNQILLNLIGNSIKFTRQGTITLHTDLIKKENTLATLRFIVTDTGIGIDNAKQKSIFDSFSQADTSTTRQYGGSGLGLSISRRLCRLMGGEISVTSEPGKGSAFSFTIICPIAKPLLMVKKDWRQLLIKNLILFSWISRCR